MRIIYKGNYIRMTCGEIGLVALLLWVSLKNHKSTKPASNALPSLARQRIAILMTFRWRVDEGPLTVVC